MVVSVYFIIMYIRTHGHQLSVSNLYVGEKIACDRYAVAVLKGEEIVGHVPRYMSTACSDEVVAFTTQ